MHILDHNVFTTALPRCTSEQIFYYIYRFMYAKIKTLSHNVSCASTLWVEVLKKIIVCLKVRAAVFENRQIGVIQSFGISFSKIDCGTNRWCRHVFGSLWFINWFWLWQIDKRKFFYQAIGSIINLTSSRSLAASNSSSICCCLMTLSRWLAASNSLSSDAITSSTASRSDMTCTIIRNARSKYWF